MRRFYTFYNPEKTAITSGLTIHQGSAFVGAALVDRVREEDNSDSDPDNNLHFVLANAATLAVRDEHGTEEEYGNQADTLEEFRRYAKEWIDTNRDDQDND